MNIFLGCYNNLLDGLHPRKLALPWQFPIIPNKIYIFLGGVE
jgi:hypothetical protein